MINIIKASKEHIDELEYIFSQYQIFYNQEPDSKKNLQFLKNVITKEEAIFHIAYINKNIGGFTGIYFSYSSVSAEKIAIINDLFVLPKYRKQGIGKKMMKHAIDYLSNSEISHIRWCTKDDNLEAQGLYKEFSDNKSKWIHYDLKNYE